MGKLRFALVLLQKKVLSDNSDLNIAIDDGLIEMTIPDKPKSIYQKYRLTEKGKKAKEEWKK